MSVTIRQRYILAVFGCFGLLMVNWMNTALSVAILDMVNSTNSKSNIIVSENCPSILGNESHRKPHQTAGKLNWSREIQGLVLSAYYWGYLIVLVPIGVLSQKYGGKWMFGGGVLLASVMTLLSPVIARTNAYLYIAARILQGIGESAANPSIMAMLGRWCPPQENAIMVAVVFSGLPIGSLAGLITVGPLVNSTFLGGWPSVFYVSGTIGVLVCIPWSFLVYDSPDKHPWISRKEKDYIVNSIGSNSKEEEFKQPIPWKRILLSRYVWVYVLSSASWGWSIYTLKISIPRFISDVLHLDITSNGLINGLSIIGYVISENVCPLITEPIISRDLITKTKVRKLFTMIALGGTGLSFFGMALAGCNRNLVIALFFVLDAVLGSSTAGFFSNALDLSPEHSGILFGLATAASTASGAVAPNISNLVAKYGSKSQWVKVLYGAGGSSIVVSIIYLLFASANRQEWNSEVEEHRPLSPESVKDTD